MQIKWDNQFVNDVGATCKVSVDGTDFRVEYRPSDSSYYTYKHNCSGLRYEVAVCIQTAEIVWYTGPYKAGEYNDITIFRQGLKFKLGRGEKVEADAGYVGEFPQFVKCPNGFGNNHFNDPAKQAKVRSRHETVNRRFKQFQALKQVYRHKIANHGAVFSAIAVIVQLNIVSGNRPYLVEYP